jgi:leader peptidase (prepilin peptidase)/N-methyltransferase
VAFQFGATWQTAALLVFTYFFVALTLIDLDEYLLPDSLTLPLIWIGLIANSFSIFTSLESAVYGAIAGYLSLWSIYWLFKLLTGKEGMGYGDFKLLAAIGALLGWQAIPVVILLSSVVGAVVGIVGIIILGRDKNIPIPFGPYLAAAGFIAALWGNDITTAYLQFTGIR